MDPDDLPGKKETKSKNQKRNENRRKKKEGDGSDDEGGEMDAVSKGVAAVKIAEAPAAAAPADADPKEALSKKVGRALAYTTHRCTIAYVCIYLHTPQYANTHAQVLVRRGM